MFSQLPLLNSRAGALRHPRQPVIHQYARRRLLPQAAKASARIQVTARIAAVTDFRLYPGGAAPPVGVSKNFDRLHTAASPNSRANLRGTYFNGVRAILIKRLCLRANFCIASAGSPLVVHHHRAPFFFMVVVGKQ